MPLDCLGFFMGSSLDFIACVYQRSRIRPSPSRGVHSPIGVSIHEYSLNCTLANCLVLSPVLCKVFFSLE